MYNNENEQIALICEEDHEWMKAAAEGRRSKAEGTRPDSVMAQLLSHKTPGFLSHSNLASGYLLEKIIFYLIFLDF